MVKKINLKIFIPVFVIISSLIVASTVALVLFLPRSSPLIVNYDENDFDIFELEEISKEVYTGNNNDDEYAIEMKITYDISFLNDTDNDPYSDIPSYVELNVLPQEITRTTSINSANHSIVFSFANGKILKTIYLSLQSNEVFPLYILEKDSSLFGEGFITIRFISL